MPTVLRVDGHEIAIYLRDHIPPHVHVFAHGGEAIVNLNCCGGEPEFRDFYRLKTRELRRILEIVKRYQAELCSMWREIYGEL